MKEEFEKAKTLGKFLSYRLSLTAKQLVAQEMQ